MGEVKEFIVLDYGDKVGSKLKKLGYKQSMWSDFHDHGNGVWIVADQNTKTYSDYSHRTDGEPCPIFKKDDFLAKTFSVPFD